MPHIEGMKSARSLRVGDRYTVPGGDGMIYRVIRVTHSSASVKVENAERKTVTIGDRSFTPETGGAVITVSPWSSVKLLEEWEK